MKTWKCPCGEEKKLNYSKAIQISELGQGALMDKEYWRWTCDECGQEVREMKDRKKAPAYIL